MNVLVIGGAGYIGSHMVRMLNQENHSVVTLDNLSTGFKDAVTAGEFYEGDLGDRKLVREILREHKIDAVMHFAACALVGESVENPAKYYQNNVVAACEMLEAMRAEKVKRIVFSSTCATYGTPSNVPISESESQDPINPYGFTKLVLERALQDYCNAYDFGFAALRYFNAAGASPAGDIGEDHDPESHLIPIVLQVALGQRSHVTIFGDDYPTPDGTCIRDYIHVNDLARAHLAALEKLQSGSSHKINLGTGKGHSVKEVIEMCRQVTELPIAVEIGKRRPGDPAELVADATLAKNVLGWIPQHASLRDIVKTAWSWHKSHPKGYKTPVS